MLLDPIFGTIDPSAPGRWEGRLLFGGRDVAVELTIRVAGLSPALVQDVLRSVEDVSELDGAARAAIARDAHGGEDSPTVLYVEHHLEELSDGELDELFNTHDREAIALESILSRLALVRIGLSPEHRDRQVLLDYSLGPFATDYLLCVSFDAAGEASGVEVES